MEHRRDRAVGIIPVHRTGDGLLFCIVREADGHWGFPKGHAEEGEVPEETALRELREETGIGAIEIAKGTTFIERYSFERDGVRYDKEVAYFVGMVRSIEGKTEEAFKKEIPEIAWLPPEEARTTITFDDARRILDDALAFVKNTLE